MNVGPIKLEEAPSLYNECDAMFLPTLLECFSASYAESMVMGKPVITTNMGFSRTVCKDAAIYFDPVDPSDISEKIRLLANSDILQKKIVENGKKRMQTFGSSVERTKEYLTICRNASLCKK